MQFSLVRYFILTTMFFVVSAWAATESAAEGDSDLAVVCAYRIVTQAELGKRGGFAELVIPAGETVFPGSARAISVSEEGALAIYATWKKIGNEAELRMYVRSGTKLRSEVRNLGKVPLDATTGQPPLVEFFDSPFTPGEILVQLGPAIRGFKFDSLQSRWETKPGFEMNLSGSEDNHWRLQRVATRRGSSGDKVGMFLFRDLKSRRLYLRTIETKAKGQPGPAYHDQPIVFTMSDYDTRQVEIIDNGNSLIAYSTNGVHVLKFQDHLLVRTDYSFLDFPVKFGIVISTELFATASGKVFVVKRRNVKGSAEGYFVFNVDGELRPLQSTIFSEDYGLPVGARLQSDRDLVIANRNFPIETFSLAPEGGQMGYRLTVSRRAHEREISSFEMANEFALKCIVTGDVSGRICVWPLQSRKSKTNEPNPVTYDLDIGSIRATQIATFRSPFGEEEFFILVESEKGKFYWIKVDAPQTPIKK